MCVCVSLYLRAVLCSLSKGHRSEEVSISEAVCLAGVKRREKILDLETG